MIRPDRGHFFILAAAILFGTTGTARALAPEGMSPAFIGALRLVIGGPVLLAATAAGGSPGITAYRVPFGATLLAAAGIAAFQICFFAAVSLTGVAVGTLVAIGSAPWLRVSWRRLFTVSAWAGAGSPPQSWQLAAAHCSQPAKTTWWLKKPDFCWQRDPGQPTPFTRSQPGGLWPGAPRAE